MTEKLNSQTIEMEKLLSESSKFDRMLKQSTEEKNLIKNQNESLQNEILKYKDIAQKRLDAMNGLTDRINEIGEKKEV